MNLQAAVQLQRQTIAENIRKHLLNYWTSIPSSFVILVYNNAPKLRFNFESDTIDRKHALTFL